MAAAFDLIRQWGHNRNLIDGSTPVRQLVKLQEEFEELEEAIDCDNYNEIVDAIGDMVVVLTLIAEQYGVTIEECIFSAYNEIKDRKGKMVNGIFVKET